MALVLAIVAVVTLPAAVLLARYLARRMVWEREIQDVERTAEQSRRQLVAFVSHDLRTPLAAIRALSEAIATAWSPRTRRSPRPKRIEQESIRLSEMVDDLFEISKINAGAVTAPYERVALDEVLDDVRNIHHISAERAGVILVVDLPPTPIRVIGSDQALVRVLSNLVANAIAHTPPGGRVSLSMGADADGRGSGWMTPGSASPTPTYRGYSTSPIADPTTGCRGRTRHCPADRDWAWRSRPVWCGHTAARCRRAICPPARVSKCGYRSPPSSRVPNSSLPGTPASARSARFPHRSGDPEAKTARPG